MSETIADTTLPGTYIEVRSEGLIGVAAIATGNIGIVGTAARGALGAVAELGSMDDALQLFGAADAGVKSDQGADNPLTLTRALQFAFGSGASTVFAVRIANGTPAPAKYTVKADDNTDAFVLTAGKGDPDPGTWGNDIALTIEQHGTPWVLTLTYGNAKETYSGAKVSNVQQALAASQLVTAGPVLNNKGSAGFTAVPEDTPAKLANGTNGADASTNDVADGLALLEDQTVNIVLVPGFGAGGTDGVAGVVAQHLERTENDAHERIALLGVTDAGSTTDVSNAVTEASSISNPRIVLVTPGVTVTDRVLDKSIPLDPSYLAASLGGLLSTLSVEVSLTNKSVPVDGLSVNYSAAEARTLVQNRVLVVRPKLGIQVVKALTTDPGAFRQISVRRIVDYAKAGVRSGADPYIGKLNNARVRDALSATLDGFLSQMVLEEKLVSYQLSVSATREQEINGICIVAMNLAPTFSIDVIRVTMTLQ